MDIQFKGITGDFKFDNTGDLILKLDIGFYKNGKLTYEDF